MGSGRRADVDGPKHEFEVVKKGYLVDDVDSFLHHIANRLETGEDLDTDMVRNKTFAIVKRGYDRSAVHRYLAELVFDLEDRSQSSSE